MVTTAFIRDCIVDKDKTSLINSAIAAGTSQYGMQTFDQSIFSLYQQGFVTLDEALRWASNVDEFKLKVQGIATTGEMTRDAMAQKRPASAWVAYRKSRGLADSAYLTALRMLARRELTVEGVRSRLRDREYSNTEISAAVDRLLETGALDDARVARAYARTAAAVKGRGRLRVVRELQPWASPPDGRRGRRRSVRRPRRTGDDREGAAEEVARPDRGFATRASAPALSVPDAPGFSTAAASGSGASTQDWTARRDDET